MRKLTDEERTERLQFRVHYKVHEEFYAEAKRLGFANREGKFFEDVWKAWKAFKTQTGQSGGEAQTETVDAPKQPKSPQPGSKDRRASGGTNG